MNPVRSLARAKGASPVDLGGATSYGMKRFNLFLITVVTFSAFLAGYLLVSGGLGGGAKTTSGTILDKFDEQGTTNKGQETKEMSQIFPISERKVISITNSLDKNAVIYYEENTGKVFEYSFADKAERAVSENILPNFAYSIWSPNKKEVISSFYSGTGSDFKYYNFNTFKTGTFSKDVKSLAFSPTGDLIVYYSFGQTSSGSLDTVTPEDLSASQAGKIILAQPDGSYSKKILSTRITDIAVSWPAKDQIALKTPASEIFLLTEDGKLTKLIEGRPYLETKWSLSGNKLLFSAWDMSQQSTDPTLFVKTVDTREEKALNISGNASKCAWSIDDVSVYCALSLSPSVDEIFRIDILSGEKELIAEPGTQVRELLVSSMERYLLFVKVADRKLYGIEVTD